MADIGWGPLADKEGYGFPFDRNTDFEEVGFESSLEVYKDFMHAAHAMLYAKDDSVLWKLFPIRGYAMMQMRFDGCIGFPGGLLDKPGESVIEALNRELEEEFALDLNKYAIVQSEHIITHVNKKKKLVTHFYAKEVDKESFKQIEKNVLNADEYGIETLGVIRAPLGTLGDGFRGLPVFLANRFAGNAKEQFLYTLHKLDIIPQDVLETAVKANKDYEQATAKDEYSTEAESIIMEHYATNLSSDYDLIKEEDVHKYSTYTQAAHAMLYAKNTDGKPLVLMHLRFDGYFGFPGGLGDEGESASEMVNRELREEIGWKGEVEKEDKMLTHVNEKTKLCLHFFLKEVCLSELTELEVNLMEAEEYGEEVLGPVRVPLEATNLQTFLSNTFIGNTKDQLLYALKMLDIDV